ncbi:MAG: hypothetical protein WAX07_05575 [Candidatus Altiarchaeia archaeon]
MTEGVIFDQSKISLTSSGVFLQSGAVTYYATLGYIPAPDRLWNSSHDKCIDYTYRGKIILFGEEYYVRDIDSPGFIQASKGIILENVSNQSFSATAYGYRFRVDEILDRCSEEGFCWLAGANFSVLKPNGSTVGIDTYDIQDAIIDNRIEVSLIEMEYTSSNYKKASIIVYDITNNIVLDNGYPLEMEGGIKAGWTVGISSKAQPFGSWMNIPEYSGIEGGQYLFVNATIRYTTPLTLNMSSYLALPAAYKVVSDGTNLEVTDIYSTSTTTTTTSTTTSSTTTTSPDCSMIGDQPPCGEISLSDIISLINAWTAGSASLNDVIALINAWAAG